MLILGVETATPSASVALGTPEGIVTAVHVAPGRPETDRSHGRVITTAIKHALELAGATPAEITGVATSVGPGLFTSIRVGLATAQTFAYAREVPMVGMTSLDLLAFPFRYQQRPVYAVIDARRGEVFWAKYTTSNDAGGGATVDREGDVQRCEPGGLAAVIAASDKAPFCVGDGAVRYRDVITAAGAVVNEGSPLYPTAATLVERTVPMFIAGETVEPDQLQPLYLRSPDVNINWETRDGVHTATTPTP